LRNSIVDTLTGTTNVRLLERLDVNHGLNVTWGDLILPRPFGDDADALPVTIVMNEKFVKHKKPHKFQSRDWSFRIDCSEDGYLRGFCIDDSPQRKFMKFTVDVTQEKCTLAVGEFLYPKWKHTKDTDLDPYICLDAASGRIWWTKRCDNQKAVVLVVDIE
jgi:hypothetical protein